MTERPSLFKGNSIVLSAATLFFFFATAVFWLSRPGSEDRKKYEELAINTRSDRGSCVKKSKERSIRSSRNDRIFVVKEIVLNDKPYRRRMRIRSVSSALTLEAGSHAAAEEMEGIACWLQEELFFRLDDGREVVSQREDGRWLIRGSSPNDEKSWASVAVDASFSPYQIIQYVEADKGSYRYSSRSLHAEDASLYRYCLPSHDVGDAMPAKEPLARASAALIDLTLSEEGCLFTAHGIRAIIPLSKEALR